MYVSRGRSQCFSKETEANQNIISLPSSPWGKNDLMVFFPARDIDLPIGQGQLMTLFVAMATHVDQTARVRPLYSITITQCSCGSSS